MKKIKNLKLFGLFQWAMLIAVFAYPVQHDAKSPASLPGMPKAFTHTSNTLDKLGVYPYWKSTMQLRPTIQTDMVRGGKYYTSAWMGQHLLSPPLSLAPKLYHINPTHAKQ